MPCTHEHLSRGTVNGTDFWYWCDGCGERFSAKVEPIEVVIEEKRP
jgi:hypothetical protein